MAEQGCLTKGARSLHVAHSVVSATNHNPERQLGLRLFCRESIGVTRTEAEGSISCRDADPAIDDLGKL